MQPTLRQALKGRNPSAQGIALCMLRKSYTLNILVVIQNV